MSASHDSADQAPGGESVPVPSHVPEVGPTPERRGPAAAPVFLAGVVLVGLVAGALTWAIGETTYNHFRPSAKAQANRFEFAALNREEGQASQKNAAVAYGTLGALVGLLLGAVAGLSRGSAWSFAVGAAAGLGAGGIGGGLAAYGVTPVFIRYYSDADPSLLLPVAVRGAVGAVVGLAAGFAFGLGRNGSSGPMRSLIGGLIGAVLGVVAFEVLNAVAFPFDRNDNLIPNSQWARLALYLLAATGAALGSALSDRDPATRKSGQPKSVGALDGV